MFGFPGNSNIFLSEGLFVYKSLVFGRNTYTTVCKLFILKIAI